MILLALLGCPTTPTPIPEPVTPLPATCDAGDDAWVQRALPLLWGRRALGAAEVRAWTAVVEAHGRPAALHAMSQSPLYVSWWREWLTDALAVARTGDKAYYECFETPLLDVHDGSLTQFLRGSDAPWEVSFGQPFNMADVLEDALVADDLAVVWQANLYARMNRPVEGANVSDEELEHNRRVNFGEGFYETYLNRNLDCIACHNSSFSVTDSPDARLDRTWQLPGRHETALLGSTTDFDEAALFAMFRTEALQGNLRPWGMDSECGSWRSPTRMPSVDLLGQSTSWFLEERGVTGSVWQVERALASGANALSDGLQIGEDGTVAGPESFAYLLGARIVDLAYETGLGGRLTIAHGFARNLEQAARLEASTDHFVQSGFSLRTLLTDLTADPLFNPGLPQDCGSQAYGLPPVVNPWSVEEDDPALRNNSPGDLVHRYPARVLLRTAQMQLERPVPLASWELTDEEADYQASIGVFLRESQTGFEGVDLQGMLAYQARFGTCGERGGGDFVSAMVEAGLGRPREHVVLAIKDRLLARAVIDPDERGLLEALLGDLSAPTTVDDERSLRLICGAILTSAPAMLVLSPTPTVGAELLQQARPFDCAAVQAMVEATGRSLESCD